jgi:Carboxylesterase family
MLFLSMEKVFLFFAVALNSWVLSGQSACNDARFGQDSIFEVNQIDTIKDVVYGDAIQHFTNQNIELKMDVFMPSMAIDSWLERPVVLMIHGGGFMGGNKTEMHFECMEFARRGFVAATISYRLGWNCDNALCINCFSNNLKQAVYQAVQDARAGLRFIHQNAGDWHVNPDLLFIGGESAGSITALLATHWNQSEASLWLPPGFEDTAGSLDSSGNDWSQMPTVRGVLNHCGAVNALDVVAEDSAVPMISFHDSNDCVVPFNFGALISCFCSGFLNFAGSNVLHNHYVANGWCSELHVAPQILPNHCTFPALNAVRLSACFMKRVLCGYCMSSQSDDIYVNALCTGFSTVSEPVEGCTYVQAVNFMPEATSDDGSCMFEPNCAADINSDGIVTVADLLLFVDAYGGSCID